VELKISAASSLKAAFTDIGAAFDKSHHTTTSFNFDASGTLQKQIEAGAYVDAFASAAVTQVNTLLTRGLQCGVPAGISPQRDVPGGAGQLDVGDHRASWI